VVGGGREKGRRVVFFRKDGVGLTDKGEIAEGFCKFYSQVGPKQAVKIKRERAGLPGLHGGHSPPFNHVIRGGAVVSR
jgi:hypothetical protein